MKIILKSIQENLNYPVNKYNGSLFEIDSLYDWIKNSNKPFKNMHAFDVLQKENKNFKGKILVDHTKYAPLLLIFNSMDELFSYCKDTCEARADKIPQNFSSALNYFANEDVYIHEIIEWTISVDEWNKIKNEIKNKSN